MKQGDVRVDAKDEPKWLKMADGERILLKTHPSKWRMAKGVFIFLAINIGSLLFVRVLPITGPPIDFPVVEVLSAVSIVAGAGSISYEYLRIKTTVYMITTKNVVYKKGIYKRESVNETELVEITDKNYSQSHLDRLLNKGQVRFENRSGDNETHIIFSDVHAPKEVDYIYKMAKERARSQYQPSSSDWERLTMGESH
jgi:hypothetical protein